MYTCLVCKFQVPLDDVEIRFTETDCTCVSCFHRMAGSTLVMGKNLRHEIQAVVNDPSITA